MTRAGPTRCAACDSSRRPPPREQQCPSARHPTADLRGHPAQARATGAKSMGSAARAPPRRPASSWGMDRPPPAGPLQFNARPGDPAPEIPPPPPGRPSSPLPLGQAEGNHRPRPSPQPPPHLSDFASSLPTSASVPAPQVSPTPKAPRRESGGRKPPQKSATSLVNDPRNARCATVFRLAVVWAPAAAV